MPKASTSSSGNGFSKVTSLILAFALVAVLGGVVSAAIAMPLVTTADVAAKSANDLYNAIPSDLEEQPLAQKSRIYAADGSLLATFYAENRTVVPLDKISKPMQNAVVAIEDKRFFEHSGVDIKGLVRAFVKNSSAGSVQSGGSTLTQQYVKNVLIEKAVSNNDMEGVEEARAEDYSRKIREAKMAITLEDKYTKQEILGKYLNIAQFGPSVYGIEAASQYYFGIPAANLSIVQAATLAGITQAPNKWDPEQHPSENQERRDTVLKVMLNEKMITKDEYDAAVKTNVKDYLSIHKAPTGCETAGNGAGYFCDYVTAVIRNDEAFGKTPEDRERTLKRGGLNIYTTLDPKKQAAAQEAVTWQIPMDDPSGVANAIVSIEPGTGKIVAMAQNRQYKLGSNTNPSQTSVNYATDHDYGGSNGFQPGSTFKAFALAEWLNEGHGLNERVNADRRTWTGSVWKNSCTGETNYGSWNPENSTKGSGSMTVLQATENSVNTAYASIQNKLDLCAVADMAKNVGVKRADGKEWHLTPSQVLGTNEVSPLSMANGYATFASGGRYCNPIAITKVTDATGKELAIPQAGCRQVVKPEVANTVSYALSKVMTSGTGRVAQLNGRISAGKTGTTDNNQSVWFVGFTPQLATAVWSGFANENKEMRNMQVGRTYLYGGATGSALSAPVWQRYMNAALEGQPNVGFPSPDSSLIVGQTVKAPDVRGQSLGSAQSTLEAAGFKVALANPPVASDQYPKDTVAVQSPDPSAGLYDGATITLTLSSGPAAQPAPGEGDQNSDAGRNSDLDRHGRNTDNGEYGNGG